MTPEDSAAIVHRVCRERDETRARLIEAEEALSAIRLGEVDGLVVAGPDGSRVFMLEGAQEPYRLLIEQMSEGALTLSQDGIVLYANQVVARMLQIPLEQIIGRDFRSFISPADEPIFADLLGEAWRGGCHGEVSVRMTDGPALPLGLGLSRMELGSQTLICVIATDLTERHQKVEELLRLHANLEARVAERTAELAASNAELEGFSYSVSHDLRAPLRAIDGFGRMLREDYAAVLDAEGLRLLGVISSETRRMGELIDDLLTFSRLGRQSLQQSTIDMTDLVRAVFDEQAARTPDRVLQLTLGPLPPAAGDPAMLRVVMTNLVSNAIKFTQGRTPAQIEISAWCDGHETVYCVKDNGVGFDMAYVSKLFGVFQRLHPAEQFEGTGVGLALAQRVVYRHGGRIWAEGEVDGGARFFFSLPSARESA